MTDARAGAEPGQYLSFFVADEEYAIGILKVKEILQVEAITKVPGAPPSIRGVTNVRGSVVPVVDLAVRFSLPETPVPHEPVAEDAQPESRPRTEPPGGRGARKGESLESLMTNRGAGAGAGRKEK